MATTEQETATAVADEPAVARVPDRVDRGDPQRTMDERPALPMLPAKPMGMLQYLQDIASPAALQAQRQLSERWDEFVDALLSPNDYVEVTERGEKKRFKKKSAWKKGARFFNISTRIMGRTDNNWADMDEQGVPHFHADVVVGAWTPWGQYAECIGSCSTRESRFYTTSGLPCPVCGGPTYDNRDVSSRPEWVQQKRAAGNLPDFTCKDRDCGGSIGEGEYKPEEVKGHAPNPVARGKARHDCYATAETRAQNRAISSLIAAGEVSAEEVEGHQQPAEHEKAPVAQQQAGKAQAKATTNGGLDLAPLDWTVASGARKGKTYRELCKSEPGFIKWLCGRTDGGEVRVRNAKLLAALEHMLDQTTDREPTAEQMQKLAEVVDVHALSSDQLAWYRGVQDGTAKPSRVAVEAALQKFGEAPLKVDLQAAEATEQQEAAVEPDEPQAPADEFNDDLPF